MAFGATFSGFWIVVANSWMQTPAGYEIQGDKAVLTDFIAAVFNPSTMPRYLHTIGASLAIAAFLMTGISAWYVRRGRSLDVAARGLRLGLIVAFVASGLMFLTGDFSAKQVAETQPEKFAAMQGVTETTTGAPMIIFSLPPASAGGDPLDGPAILVNRLLSFMAYGNWDATVVGTNAFPADEVPPITPTFLSYHNMVAIGTLMLLLMASGAWLAWRRRIERSRTWLLLATLAIPLPMLAIQLGWATAEIGRQPWIVYGLMLHRRRHLPGRQLHGHRDLPGAARGGLHVARSPVAVGARPRHPAWPRPGSRGRRGPRPGARRRGIHRAAATRRHAGLTE